jgi:hypothetical protein
VTTWKSKRTVVRSHKSGHFAKKGWGRAYHRERIRSAIHTLFVLPHLRPKRYR